MPVHSLTGQEIPLPYDQGTILASAARTASPTKLDQSSGGARGVAVTINVTAAPNTAETLTPTVQWKDPASGVYGTILAGAAIVGSATQAGTTVRLLAFPGSTVTANLKANDTLPLTWAVDMAHSSTGSWTYSVGYQLLP